MRSLPVLLLLSLALIASAARGAKTEWVTVGDPGNRADDVWPPNVTYIAPAAQVALGQVDYVYRMGKYEITNSQYAEFLNAVAHAGDPYDLYDDAMNPDNVLTDFYPVGGIIQQGGPGDYQYQLVAGREQWPVTNVSFWSAIRFANWVHNGQPQGPEGNTTTEDGAYTITLRGTEDNTIVRNPGARVFLPSEDEWYKAAYYKGGGTDAGYWEFATGSDEPPIAENPPGGVSAAYLQPSRLPDRPVHIVHEPEDVGAYVNSPSPSGTFDQAGNATEWNDTVLGGTGRGARGGHFLAEVEFISASGFSPDWREIQVFAYRSQREDPFFINPFVGFRLASVDVLPGDVNQNGLLDVDDLNEITSRVRDNSPDTWYDLTVDGKVDGDDRDTWVHDLKGTHFGDANLDGVFDSHDFVVVFQAGEYEDDVPLNSTWLTGDWNGNGEFTSGDLVLALIDGGFDQGQPARHALVPEPSTTLLAAFAIIGSFSRTRRTEHRSKRKPALADQSCRW